MWPLHVTKNHKVKLESGMHNSSRQNLNMFTRILSGMERVTTHGGGFYFNTVMDNSYRIVWVHVLRNKRETFEKFKE